MNTKYEFTGETKNACGSNLKRIRARSSFGNVAAGDMGGWIESEQNLQIAGNAWVSGNARVSGDAQVYGNARVSGDAWVSGNARVSGDAQVYGNARVSGDADLLCIGPIGSRRSTLTAAVDEKLGVRLSTGCFSGSIAEFRVCLEGTHDDGAYRIEYDGALVMIVHWMRAHGHAVKEAS